MTAEGSRGTRVERAAALLARSRRDGRPFAGFDDDLRPRDSAEAYAIQAALHALLSARGDEAVGWKIGCTTPAMQEYLGIREPAAGRIRAASVQDGPGRVVRAGLTRPGVECELAVRLAADLAAPCDREAARAAIGSVLAAIEIVDERYDDWRALDAATLTADDFFGAGAILGREDVPWRELDLGAVTATMRINGEDVGSGSGADILGDPLEALLWLVHGPARETGLRAGSIVLLGSLVVTRWVEQGDVVTIDNVPFGSVSVEFV
ncbi:MAG TPA: fumarylacetoacetate hydrolase family protein [Gaiellales bacterium]|jgi:2-oxo-3-hexenedioate decarboxylase/2-keto-4-pentenoate hydratase